MKKIEERKQYEKLQKGYRKAKAHLRKGKHGAGQRVSEWGQRLNVHVNLFGKPFPY